MNCITKYLISFDGKMGDSLVWRHAAAAIHNECSWVEEYQTFMFLAKNR